jgi:nitroimidazol reductase NimA-like FMN-containing flavoprotein (pyridoxamine 5'-phosphate oxidase superfamily)
MDAGSEKLLAYIIRNTRLAALGTLRDDAPLVSLVAYVAADDFSAFYIHVSRLAQHAIDMQKDKHVGLMIAETDDGRAAPQALARISIRGAAEILPAGQPGYNPVKQLYIERFPESEPLFEPGDFEVWRILPKGARYVAGVAKAYNLTPDALLKAASHRD